MKTSTAVGRVVSALVCAVLLFGLIGCSADDSAESLPPDGYARSEPANDGPAEDIDLETERQIARTGALTVEVDDVAAAAERVRSIATQAGGIISNEFVMMDELSVSTLTLSVPSERMEQVMDQLATVGTLESRSSTAEDITTQVVDVDARIETLREAIARLQDLMDRAGSVGEIAKVESELTARQSDLESLLARQKVLKQRVEQVSITVTLISSEQLGTGNPFLDGLRKGWQALINSAAAALTLVGAVIPFLGLGALVVAPLVVWWRRSHRQTRSEHPPASAASAVEPGEE